MNVRLATLDDLYAVAELDAVCFAQPWGLEAWRVTLESDEFVLLAAAPARALACAVVIDENCELRRLGVVPGARRTGLARSLLLEVIARARRAGCLRVQLEVAERNLAACTLYRAHGFCVVGRRPGYYREPPDAAVLMDLEIGSEPR